MREAKDPSTLSAFISRDIPLGVMLMLLLSSLDSHKYSPSSSARIPVIVRVLLTPSSSIWKRLLGLISTAFLRHTTFPLAWLTSQLKVTLPPISALTASSFLVNFTGISKMQRKEKNYENAQVNKRVLQNQMKNPMNRHTRGSWQAERNPKDRNLEILSAWNYIIIFLQCKNSALKRLKDYLPMS